MTELDAWQELARARMPGGDVLTLRRRGDAFEIRFNLLELMSSRNAVSETALARIAGGRIERDTAHVLIGGLGMGYTLRSVLNEVGPGARVTVAELVPEVIAWNRGPLAGLAGRPLDDPRVVLHAGDVTDAIRANPDTFDAILMDVDNGPEAVFVESNHFLYSADGVRLILSGLKGGGVLAVWSADPSPGFERVLAASRFERVDVAIRGEDGPRHTIYLVAAP
jgi:spermidine synthase